MKTIEYEYYEVLDGGPAGDGFNRSVVACFAYSGDAKALKRTSGYYTVHHKKVGLEVFDSYDEYVETVSAESRRRAALLKLTDDEKALLGLKDES